MRVPERKYGDIAIEVRILSGCQRAPPTYFTPAEIAAAILCDVDNVKRLMAETVSLEPGADGYPSAEVYAYLNSL